MEDLNNKQNRSIKAKFIRQHIFKQVTLMVDYVIAASRHDVDAPFHTWDISNYIHYEDQKGRQYSQEQKDEQIHQWMLEANRIEKDLGEKLENLGSLLLRQIELETLAEQLYHSPEIYKTVKQWWVVSADLARMLDEN